MRKKRSKGIIFIGVAVSLPLILIALFIFLYMGQYMLAKSTLKHAVLSATRFSATRGKTSLVWKDSLSGIMEKIVDFQGGASLPSSLKTDDFAEGQATTDYAKYMEMLGLYPAGTQLKDLQPEVILGLVTAYESIKSRMGGNVKYPCSPEASGGKIPILDEPNCLACYPINADSGTFKPERRNVVHIKCMYNPSNLFIRPILSLFSALGMPSSQWTIVQADAMSRIDGGLMCLDNFKCLDGS